MNQYTDILEEYACTLLPTESDYEEKLLLAASLFRRFDEAMTAFLLDYGYTGAADDAECKASYIRSRFSSESITAPRGISDWFTKHMRIERDTAFQICFAFGLDEHRTNEFFKKVYLERSFDCHSIKEAVYYYCMRNCLTYKDALYILERTPNDVKSKITDNKDVLYTGTIIDQLNSITDKETLIRYINENAEGFGYNNVTATRYIQRLWAEIAGTDGLAYKEGQLIIQGPASDDDYITVPTDGSSVWNIYCQILGLDRHQTKSLNTGRSIKPFLIDNKLLHPLAEASFPDRDGINKLLNGAHVSNERVRKLIILLVFYSYWADRIVKTGSELYSAQYGDSQRCLYTITKYLLDSGYPTLYSGNPYDWIFLWAMKDEYPLSTFRNYMGELFAVKSEQSTMDA